MGKGKCLANRQPTDTYEVTLRYLKTTGYWETATKVVTLAGKDRHDEAGSIAKRHYGPSATLVRVVYQ